MGPRWVCCPSTLSPMGWQERTEYLAKDCDELWIEAKQGKKCGVHGTDEPGVGLGSFFEDGRSVRDLRAGVMGLLQMICLSPKYQNLAWCGNGVFPEVIKVKSKCYSLSCVRLFVTPWTVLPANLSVHGILQAWILEWVAISFSRGSFWLRDQTQVSCIEGRFSTIWATREAQSR